MWREGMSWCGRFQLGPMLGSGSFGDVYLVKDNKQRTTLACKTENEDDVLLAIERRVYHRIKNSEGFPSIHWFGIVLNKRVMIMDRLGRSLDDYFEDCGGQFSIKTTLLFAHQALQRIRALHTAGYIHRDIKPENFVMGRGEKQRVVYLIDMGLCKKYEKDGIHIPYREGRSLTGTARYASLWALRGCEQGRRDDLMSLGFVLMYFLRGHLPWQKLKEKKQSIRYQLIAQLKHENITQGNLCAEYPKEFQDYFNYCINLNFCDTPDYDYLSSLFINMITRLGFSVTDTDFDWIDLDSFDNLEGI